MLRLWWEKRKLKRIAEGEKRRRLCAESGTCQNCGVKAHGPLCVECRARKTDRQRELRAGAERMRLPSSQTPEQRLSQAHRTEKKSRDAAGGTLGQHLRNVLAKFDENPEGFRAFLVSEINKRSDSKHKVTTSPRPTTDSVGGAAFWMRQEVFKSGGSSRTFSLYFGPETPYTLSMNNAIRISYHTNNYRSGRVSQTVVIQRDGRILANAERATFKEALSAARKALWA